MRRLAQSTANRVTFKAFLSADHSSAATGKTITVTLSKNGGAFGNPSAGATNATEIASGWYYVDLSTTDTNTLGDLVIRATETTIDPAEQIAQVVNAATGGLTNLDAAISAVKSKTDSLTFTVAGMIDANVVDWKSDTAPAMTGDAYARLGAPAGASVSADIAAVKADTATIISNQSTINTNVLAVPAAVWSVGTRQLTSGANIVLAKGTGITGFNDLDASGIRGAVGMASANLDTQLAALPTANENADALLDRADGIETGLTLRGALRIDTAALVGKASGLDTTAVKFRNTADTKDRISATVDTYGNRTAVTVDAT